MMSADELAAIRQRSEAVLCSNLLHLCERGVIRSLKDVPRLLADLEAATATLERVRAAIQYDATVIWWRDCTSSDGWNTLHGFVAHLRSLLEGTP